MKSQKAGEALREVMRQVPAPVTVVTARRGSEMRGITIGSFTSVSLDPPLISFNVQCHSKMHGLIVGAERFAIHILSADQVELSEHFATPDLSNEAQFEAVSYHFDAADIPILDHVLAVISCVRHAVFEAGDHSILLGRVLHIEDGAPSRPLLYYNQAYHGLGQSLLDKRRNGRQ